MGDDYTTVRVKKTTRDALNKLASSKGVSTAQLIDSLTRLTKDTSKQILLNVDQDRFHTLNDMARILHQMKLINNPNTEDAIRLAINNLLVGIEKSMSSTNNFQYSQSMGSQGQ